MKHTEIAAVVPQNFSDLSKVWIFQSNRAFIAREQEEINEQLLQFYSQWMSHGSLVKSWARVLFGQFIVVMADDTQDRICGSATDAMMRLMKSIERQYEVTLFDRLMLTFLVNDQPEMLPFHQVTYAFDKGFINEDTLLFSNSSVQNKQQLLHEWLVPVKESWLAPRLTSQKA